MATAGGSYEAGAGGPVRRRPFRRGSTTPYDRPPSILRNPTEGGKNGWLSKLVDPASKIITRSAQRFFSSVFRKSLPAPQTVPETNDESRDEFRESLPINHLETQERINDEIDDHGNSFDQGGFSELEQLLKQKTFTRAEIDRLTKLLQSRTVDVPAGDEAKRIEASASQPVAASAKKELNIAMQEHANESRRLLGGISAPCVSSSVLEDDVASPADLAKAYMGSRPSKVSPSMLVSPRSAAHGTGASGVSENGFFTSRPRGRSAIYSMARSPYSRFHSTATHKGAGGPLLDGYAGPSALSERENNTFSARKQLSKRSFSVFDHDIGSVGPIRRIRQKTNLMTSRNMSLYPGTPLSNPRAGVGSDVNQGSAIRKPLLLDGPKHNTSNMHVENGDSGIASTSFSSVPSQSTEMAQKILQQLDKLVPSPKEKSSELKLVAIRDKSPTKLTHNMLHGQALRSMEVVDSPKLVHNVQNNGSFDALGATCLPSAQDSTSQKQDKIEENGPTKISFGGDRLVSTGSTVDSIISIKETAPSTKTTDAVSPVSASDPLQKKRAFRMSANEDFLDLDDDYCDRNAATPLTASKDKLVASVVESEGIASEPTLIERPSVSSTETEPPLGSILNKSIETRVSDGSMTASKNTSFTFSAVPASSTVAHPVSLTPPLLSPSESAVPSKESFLVPMFSSGTKSIEKAPPISFASTSSSFIESSGLKSDAQLNSKLENHGRFDTEAANAIVGASKASASGIESKDDSQKARVSSRDTENATLSGASPPTIPSIFGATTNTSSLNNGSLAASTSIFSFSASSGPVSSSSPNMNFCGGPTAFTTTVSASSCPTTVAAPTVSAAPIFQFGSSTSSIAPTNSVLPSLATSVIEPTDSESKTKPAFLFGSSPIGMKLSSSTGTSSSIFGFTASSGTGTILSSSASNHSQSSSIFAASTGSLFGAQTSPAGTTGATSLTQSIPSQFGSASSSPTFGLSGASASTSGTSLFNSSTPATKLFGSSSGFGLSSSAAFSMSSGSSTTSPIFNPIFGSTSSPATGFSFGGTSSSVVASGSAPTVFGSSVGPSSGSIFSFTSAAAAAAPSASISPSQPVFGSPSPVVAFGSASPGNDQMNMEDSMAEDTMQASMPAVPAFGQPVASPAASNFFGSPVPSGMPSFQFGSQQNMPTPQNPSLFQASGNLGLESGGSFSLGTGGTDKSNRRYIKPVRRGRKR